MTRGIRLTVHVPQDPANGLPLYYEVVDSSLRTVADGVLTIGDPALVGPTDEHDADAYVVRLLLPSGRRVEGEVVHVPPGVPHTGPVEHRIDVDDLFPLLPYGQEDAAALVVPQRVLEFTDFRDPLYATTWARLWEHREGAWRVSDKAPESLTSAASAVRLTFAGLPPLVHLLQVGSDRTPWQFHSMPDAARVAVTVRPAGTSAGTGLPRLSVTAVGQDLGAHALLGYLARNANRPSALVARHLWDQKSGTPSALRRAALGFQLLREPHPAAQGPQFARLLPPDGETAGADLGVVAAWYLLERMRAGLVEPSTEAVAKAFLDASGTLPACTEGLRLLVEGLRSIDGLGPRAARVRAELGTYNRVLGASDTTAPLLTFHGAHPGAPRPARNATRGCPEGALLLVHSVHAAAPSATTPSATAPSNAPDPAGPSSVYEPPADTLREIEDLLARIESRLLPTQEWQEVAVAVAACTAALETATTRRTQRTKSWHAHPGNTGPGPASGSASDSGAGPASGSASDSGSGPASGSGPDPGPVSSSASAPGSGPAPESEDLPTPPSPSTPPIPPAPSSPPAPTHPPIPPHPPLPATPPFPAASWEEALVRAVDALRLCTVDRAQPPERAVAAPDPVHAHMAGLQRHVLLLLARAGLEPASSLPGDPTERPAGPRHDPARLNAEIAARVNSAHDVGDPELLHESIANARLLREDVPADDPIRPAVLVNLGHALKELYRWTQDPEVIVEAVQCLTEAVALTPPEDPALERRVADLAEIQAFHRLGGRPGGALLTPPHPTSTTAHGTLELTFQASPDTRTGPVPRRSRGRRPEPVRPSGPLPPDPDTPRRTGKGPNGDGGDTASVRKRVRQLLAPLRPLPGYDYEHYSRLAGPLTTTRGSGPTRVRYRSLLSMEPHRFRAALLLIAAPVLSLALLVWLLQPAHWLHSPGTWPVMVALLGGIEAARLVMITSNAHAALFARDPVPLVPETGTRVAFLTAFVPGKEPLEMLRNTLTAAVRVRHRGLVHVWLLDEGDDPEARAMCEDLGVHHFSRKGVPRWNQRKGNLRAKTKHGNYNAWLDAHGADYEFIAAVDTDHVPLPNFLERMLGYFRDKDVAFVVGPQVYGNYDNAVTRGAESQQYLFHALIQRAGNRYGSPMLVGTNLTVRRSVLQQIGGFQDSITEDFLTGLRIHQGRNPDTGQRWRSVYTPDVLAVGEGPSSWTDFFTQQMRWSRGTYETLLTAFWKAPFTLSRGTLLNYLFLLSWYPLVSLTWILAGVSLGLYYMQGAGSVTVDPVLWLLLFGNATALQIGLYVWNRRHNVSPHEPAGSSGVAGMAMSAILAPIYAWTLLNALLRRRSRFVVTPKGDSASPDVLGSTFRVHLFWATCLTGLAVYGAFAGRTHPAMLVWTTLTVLVCLAPVLVYVVQSRRLRREWQDRREASRTGTDETRR